jgi:hypothetical protein
MKKWGIYIAIAAGVYIFNAAMRADRDDTGAIVGEGNIDAFTIRVGDCFNDSSPSFGQDGSPICDLPGVPCAEPHDNEVFAVFDVGVTSFPEGDAMPSLVFDSCLERFESFVGKDYESSSLDIATLYPTQESWNRHDDREVVCAVYDISSKKLVGSVKGLAL